MKIELSFAHLHSPLFFARVNWGDKLDIKNTAKGKIKLTYDQSEKELIVECGQKKTILPTTSVFSMEPILDIKEEPIVNSITTPPRGKIKPQASGPNDHVFGGLGAGKTNDK